MIDIDTLMDDQPQPRRVEVSRIGKFYDFLKITRQVPIVALWGGAGSGKSQSICQELVDRFYIEDDLRILVIRKTGPSLTSTTYQMVQDVLASYGYSNGDDYELNKAERTIKHGTNIMWFQSLDKEEKKKSLNITHAYIEEATEINWEEYLQIRLRLRYPTKNGVNQIFLSFNPTDEYHWTKREVLDRQDGTQIAALHSTYRDNPFLPSGYREQLLRLQDIDQAYYKIYAMGEYAVIQNLIYTNWTTDNMEIHQPPFAMGLDFGYNNPTAMVAVWNTDTGLYLKELLYQTHLTNMDLVERLKQIIPPAWHGVPIYADAAEPARIEEIQRAGFNVHPAIKDVNKGIMTVKSYRLHVHQDSVNLIRELRGYKWREDRNGRVLEEPVKLNDHLMDALRYACASCELVATPTFKSPRMQAARRISRPRTTLPGFNIVTPPRMG